jgi:hypothetical protein
LSWIRQRRRSRGREDLSVKIDFSILRSTVIPCASSTLHARSVEPDLPLKVVLQKPVLIAESASNVETSSDILTFNFAQVNAAENSDMPTTLGA